MIYKKEFSLDFELGFNLADYPYLIDKSWHNDVCPSFYFNVGEQYYVLWVDYPEQEKREYSNKRYLVQEAKNEGDQKYPEISSSDGEMIFEGEFIEDLNYFLGGLVCKHANIVN